MLYLMVWQYNRRPVNTSIVMLRARRYVCRQAPFSVGILIASSVLEPLNVNAHRLKLEFDVYLTRQCESSIETALTIVKLSELVIIE